MTVNMLNTIQRWLGLSSDTKPSSPDAGSEFYETDTGDTYRYDGSSWNLVFDADIHESIWSAQASTDTQALDKKFKKCQCVILEWTTSGFTGTLDIQGKMASGAAYSNIPYTRQDVAQTPQPSVAQITYTTDTGVYRYAIMGYWRFVQVVMTRSAGTITLSASGQLSAGMVS